MKRRAWTAAEIELLHARYPHERSDTIARDLGRRIGTVYQKARKLGLAKSDAYLASTDASRLRYGDHVGAAYRFQKGHVPANKGLRRPGWGPGRMQQTQFKKGQWPINKDPEYYVLGALRVNSDGYIDMRTSFAPGSSGWTPLHRVLWEDANGPVPPGFALCFKDRDKLNVELDNLEIIPRAELMRRNTIHNLPPQLKSTIQLLGALKRKIRREEQDRGPAQPPVRNPGGAA